MKDLKLPESLRQSLKKPFGELIRENENPAEKIKQRIKNSRAKLIVVGDASYEKLLEAGIKPHLAIVDFKVKRQKYKEIPYNLKVNNPAGNITAELWHAIREKMEEGGVIAVEGEEDLAVLPCILEADFGDVIIYGQPDEGVVFINVNGETKQKAGMIIKIMELEQNEA